MFWGVQFFTFHLHRISENIIENSTDFFSCVNELEKINDKSTYVTCSILWSPSVLNWWNWRTGNKIPAKPGGFDWSLVSSLGARGVCIVCPCPGAFSRPVASIRYQFLCERRVSVFLFRDQWIAIYIEYSSIVLYFILRCESSKRIANEWITCSPRAVVLYFWSTFLPIFILRNISVSTWIIYNFTSSTARLTKRFAFR